MTRTHGIRPTRLRFIAVGASTYATIGTLRSPAGAAEFTFKCSTDAAADHPISARAIEAAAEILQSSGGRLEVRVFPNQTLGGQGSIMGLIRTGAVEMSINYDGVTETVVSLAGMSSVPSAFATHKDAWSTMDGAFGKYIRASISKVGLYAMDKAWDAGFREVENSTRPIRTPSDLKGLKIRVPDSPIGAGLFKALGAAPTPVSSTEMYAALQTHLVDGIDVPLVILQVRKLYEVQKYVSYTHHMWTGFHMLVNGEVWQQLPRNLRDLTERAFNAAALRGRDDALKADSKFETQLKGEGMLFNEVDIPSFRLALKTSGFYAQWRDHYGVEAWTKLENAVGQQLR
jgi:TRAP-type transport system periplasmic protein